MIEPATLPGKNIHAPLLQGHSSGWKTCESSWPSGKPWDTAAGWKLLQEVIIHPQCVAPAWAGISPELGKVIWCELPFGKRVLCLPAEPLQEKFHQPWTRLFLPSPSLFLPSPETMCPGTLDADSNRPGDFFFILLLLLSPMCWTNCFLPATVGNK